MNQTFDNPQQELLQCLIRETASESWFPYLPKDELVWSKL